MNITVSVDAATLSPEQASAWLDKFSALRDNADGVSGVRSTAALPVAGMVADETKEEPVKEIIGRWDAFDIRLKPVRTKVMTDLHAMGYTMLPPEARSDNQTKTYLRVIHPHAAGLSIGWLTSINFSFIGVRKMLSTKVLELPCINNAGRYPKIVLSDPEGVDLMLRIARAALDRTELSAEAD